MRFLLDREPKESIMNAFDIGVVRRYFSEFDDAFPAYLVRSGGDPRSGATLLRQATGDGTGDPRILYHFAVALNDSGDKDGAKKALETVVANQSTFKEKELAQKLLDDLSKGT